ncbi:MAG: hypothetical protein CME25_02475 [Gemmatimonadetes bacterium]|nr:hypothetical protein [Gemmatimonadota bacterium]|tara:strand:- start:8080 stop:8727 length:648 start_codon:yes stop_codon:yes gene_type:complete
MNSGNDIASLKKRIQDLEAECQLQKTKIDRLKKENRRWARLAGTEALTGLPNKISFLRALAPQAIQQAAKEKEPVGFILLSADNLGPINEGQGREAGDQIIKGLGELLRSLLEESDRIGHLDGTHFAVILFPADLDGARGKANMIRARVRAHGFPCGDATAQITVSVGVTSLEPSEGVNGRELAEEIFSRLNGAVYAAKKADGNQVELAQDNGSK